jgi:hypothetical protein
MLKDHTPLDKKYFGLIGEGNPDYWFELSEWANTCLIAGYDHYSQYPNGNFSIGFDFWDFRMYTIHTDPRISQEINCLPLQHAKFDLLVFKGANRKHRTNWLKMLASIAPPELKVITDNKQNDFPTNYRSFPDYEDYFNKLGIEKFEQYTSCTGFYDNDFEINIDFMPHRRIFGDSLVNAVLETTCYNTEYPFLTEKTYKALINLRPFVILGDTNILRKLRKEGFQTFDEFCDESYDQEVDLDLRTEKTINATLQLIDACKLHPEKIDKICQHNKQHFFKINRLENKLSEFGKLCLEHLYNYKELSC